MYIISGVLVETEVDVLNQISIKSVVSGGITDQRLYCSNQKITTERDNATAQLNDINDLRQNLVKQKSATLN